MVKYKIGDALREGIALLEENNIGILLNFKKRSDMLLVIVLKHGPTFFDIIL